MYQALLRSMLLASRQASAALSILSENHKNQALHGMAQALLAATPSILAANERDKLLAKQNNLSEAFLERLMITPERVQAMAHSLEQIASLPDPVGKQLASWTQASGLRITRMSVPIGVIAVVYESRPNVTVDAAGLCLKSANAVVLRCGSESIHSSQAIVQALHQGLAQAKVNIAAVQILPSSDRALFTALLERNDEIDLLIPRGGPALIEFVHQHTRIPLLQHLAGLCHTYIHQDASIDMARKIVFNAKLRRPGICGATEVLLVDRAIVHTHLRAILEDLLQAGCEIRAEAAVCILDSRLKLANSSDYDTEFLAPILAVKVVENDESAIAHIERHGTHHTDAIITDNPAVAQKFLQTVNSAIVMHNTSTQFADGGEFGMGAEIGIATGKLHARGPVGAEQLTTFKYLVEGHGEIRR